jgi:hypothetical protein
MLKQLSFVCAVLIACTAWGQASQSAPPLRAAVLESLGRAVLSSHGDNFLVVVSKGKFNIRVNEQKHPIIISAAEGNGKTMDWYDHAFDSGAMNASSDKTKQMTLNYTYVYQGDDASADSRRGKAEQAPAIDATAQVTLRVYDDKPGLHVTYKLTNPGQPYVYYLLPWIGGSAQGFVVPGGTDPIEHEYAGKYVDVSVGKMSWVLVKRDDQHVGLIFPDGENVFIGEYGSKPGAGGSIYLNAIPRYPQLKTGESMTIDMVIVPVDDTNQLIEAALAYGVGQ